MKRVLLSGEVAEHSPAELRDHMGWSETPESDACAVIMRLCDIIAALEHRLEIFERSPALTRAEEARPNG